MEVTLGFRGEYDDVTSTPVVNRINKIVKNLGGVINDDGIAAEISSDALYIKFALIGSRKIDIAYTLERMVSLISNLHCLLGKYRVDYPCLETRLHQILFYFSDNEPAFT